MNRKTKDYSWCGFLAKTLLGLSSLKTLRTTEFVNTIHSSDYGGLQKIAFPVDVDQNRFLNFFLSLPHADFHQEPGWP